MDRREFLAGAAALATASTAIAQEPARRRMAIVDNAAPVTAMHIGAHTYYGPMLEELAGLGWIEGETLTIDRFTAGGSADRFPVVAAEIVRSQPELIYARGHTGMLLAFKEVITEIPIVAVMAPPVETGLVESLARPGGNLTGPTVDAGVDLQMKRMQLLLELAPDARRIGWINRRSLSIYTVAAREAAVRTGVTLVEDLFDPPMGREKYREAFRRLEDAQIDALMVGNAIENNEHREIIAALAADARLPAIYAFPAYAHSGGLITYGPDVAALFRRAAHYVDRILNGDDPAEMPVEQPTEFNLAINLGTARDLGLAFPTKILLIATEVIE